MSVEDNGVVTGGDRKHSPETRLLTSSTITVATSQQRLRLNPNKDHKPESYEDLKLEFSPAIFSSIERYLTPSILGVGRNEKVKFMREILLKYLPLGERNRARRHREYRQKIMSNYQPLHREIYTMHPTMFFPPAFFKAVSDNSEEAYRNIMSELTPGIFTFDIFQPRFCELLISEVENIEKWVSEAKIRIMRPNTMNKYGAVLDDFSLETMLEKLMENFVRPISKAEESSGNFQTMTVDGYYF